MTETDVDRVKFYRSFLVLMVIAISALFFAMIRDFVMTLLLAAIFSGLAYPLYRRLYKSFGERRVMASAVTILIAKPDLWLEDVAGRQNEPVPQSRDQLLTVPV